MRKCQKQIIGMKVSNTKDNKGRKELHKILKTILVIIIIISIYILLFNGIKLQNIIMKKIYPINYSEYVYNYAQEYNVDPLLVFAIIKAESNFDPNIVSKSNAKGLMQLMETTANEIASKLEIEYIENKTIFNPEINIKIGIRYFKDLLNLYDGNQLLAMTAYNAGIGNVDKWIQNGIIKKDGSDIENIPFKETNNYVRKIIRDYRIYQELY